MKEWCQAEWTQKSLFCTEFSKEFIKAFEPTKLGNWKHYVLYDAFYADLTEKVKDEMAAQALPKTPENLIEMADSIDCCIRERARSVYSSGSNHTTFPPFTFCLSVQPTNFPFLLFRDSVICSAQLTAVIV